MQLHTACVRSAGYKPQRKPYLTTTATLSRRCHYVHTVVILQLHVYTARIHQQQPCIQVAMQAAEIV
jgi:hypothetical protein